MLLVTLLEGEGVDDADDEGGSREGDEERSFFSLST